MKNYFMKKTLKRFLEIWKPDFLKKLTQEENQKTTWKFWFFYNSIAAIIISIAAIVGLGKFMSEGMEYLANNYSDAKIVVENGKLNTEGFNEPIFQEDENGESIFVVDTKNAKYDVSVLEKYPNGVFIGADKFYNKKNEVEMRSYSFSKITNGFSVTQGEFQNLIKNNLEKIYSLAFVFVFGMLLFFFAGLKLIGALWWALIFWVLALILSIKEMTFQKTFYAVLNFYFIILIFQTILMFSGISFPFSTTLVFLILFGINFWKIKKDVAPIVIENKESKMEIEEKENVEENK